MRIANFFLLFTFYTINSNAQDVRPLLKCSANGAQIYHIPGAFTSQSDQVGAERSIRRMLIAKPNYFDLKSQDTKTIPIASQGLFMDKLNYIMLSLPPGPSRDASWLLLGSAEFGFNIKNDLIAIAKVGGVTSAINKGGAIVKKLRGTVKNGKFITQTVTGGEIMSLLKMTSSSLSVSTESLNSIKGALEPLVGQDKKDFLTRGGKILSLIDFSSPVKAVTSIYNSVSIAALEEKFSIDMIDQQRDTLLGSYFTTDKNIKNIASEITKKLEENKKVIINAHGEGNQLVESAIAEIKNNGSEDQKEKLSKFVSILATSPTTGQYLNKYFPMKHNFDFRDFGGRNIGYNYEFSKDNPLIDFVSNNRDKHKGYHFLNFYIGSIVKGRKNVQGATEQTMRENYASELRLAAESLEDNCLIPIIKVSSSQFMSGAIENKFVTTGFAGQVVKLKVDDIGGDPDKNGVDDEGYDRSKTIFTYKVETHYPAKAGVPASVDVTEDELVGSGQFISIPTPYQDLDYRVTIKAVQPSSGREDTYSLSFKVGQNKPLTASLLNKSCYVDYQGYNPLGSLDYKIVISDDEYLYDGKVSSYLTSLRQDSYTVRDSAHSFTDEISNNCPIVKKQIAYSVWASCQTTGCVNVEPYNPNCYLTDTQLYNTGTQYNFLVTYTDVGEILYSRSLGEGYYGSSNSRSEFTDPNDSSKKIGFTNNGICKRGSVGDPTGAQIKVQ